VFNYWCANAVPLSTIKALTPLRSAACNNLGIFLQENGELGAATANFKGALEFRSSHPDAEYNRGIALLHKGQTSEISLGSLAKSVPFLLILDINMPIVFYPIFPVGILRGQVLKLFLPN
jgi:hypothetical protein